MSTDLPRARLTHPGPAPEKRWAAEPCRATPVDLILPVTSSLAESVAQALEGFDGAWLVIEDAPLGNLEFVIPGNDPTGEHAAWYAGPHRMGAGRIHHLGLHAGRKNGAPWLHGHGVFSAPRWQGPTMGHILPLESRLSQPLRAVGWGLTGAGLDVTPDPETRFPLFQPQPRKPPGRGAALITLRPNQDISQALGTAAATAGITDGRVFGLGSIVHPHLIDQPPIDSYATEILLTEGRISGGVVHLEAEIVTLTGAYHKGWLMPGGNTICITAELLVIAD